MRLSRKTLVGVAAATAIGVGGVAVAVPAIASTNGSSTSSTSAAAKKHSHADHLRQHELKIAATTIGITPKELREQLRAGKSLKEIAAAHGVSEEKLVAALEKGLDPWVQKLVEHKAGQKKPAATS